VLIARLERELDTAVIMITHDLGVVAEVTDSIAVMYAGRVVEMADKREIFRNPEHPYTWGLLRSIPRLDRPRDEPLVPIPGRPPSLIAPPAGCRFYPRCFYEPAEARDTHPDLEGVVEESDHSVRCLLAGSTRRQIWEQLQQGKSPDQVKRELTVETGAG